MLVKVISIFCWNKGGRQSSCKAILACINQRHPCSKETTILFGSFQSQKYNYSALAAMADLDLSDLEDLRADRTMFLGVTRLVQLKLLGDHCVTTSTDRHAGASCRSPCCYCSALARPSAKAINLIRKCADYGIIQDGSRDARI